MNSFELGTGATISNSYNGPLMGSNRGFTRLSMERAATIYQYYMYEEALISVCKKTSNNLTFKGSISWSWGGSQLQSITGESETNLKRLLKKSLDFRNMFGMCPIRVIQDPVDPKKRTVTIPPFGTGDFMGRIDPETSEIEIIYSMGKEGAAGVTNSMVSNEDCINLPVFVWPGHEPDIKKGLFSSDMFKLYKEFISLSEVDDNQLDGDYIATHPTVFTQHRKEAPNPLDDFEDEEYAGGGEDTEGYKRTYKRQVRRAKILEDMQTMAKESNVGIKRAERAVVDPVTQGIGYKRRRQVWEDNERNIPEGEELVTHTQPKNIASYQDRLEHYEQAVCLVMGMPKTYITRQSSGKGLKGDVQNEQNLLRTTVIDDRQCCSMFYSFVHNLLHRDTDDSMIVNSLAFLDEAKRAISARHSKSNDNSKTTDGIPLDDEEENYKRVLERASKYGLDGFESISKAKSHLKRVGKKKDRVELIFDEDPFVNVFDVGEILQASDRYVFTPEEEVNLLRRKYGYPPLPPNHELIKNNEAVRKLKIDALKTKTEPPAAAPGSKKVKQGEKDKKKKEKSKEKKSDDK